MAGAPTKTPRPVTTSIQPRPRSPAQFVAMMRAIVPFDGSKWWLKDIEGNLVTQIAVGKAIAESAEFKLAPKKEEVMQYRTYVTMNPPTLGFAYVDDQDILHITPSGREIVSGEALQTLFLRQLTKWQYPSNVHGGSGGKGATTFPLREEWSIHPFLSAVKLCLELEYLSKEEVAAFLLPMRRDDQIIEVVERIRKARKELSKLKGQKRKARLHELWIDELREAYAEEIADDRYKVRQRKTNTVEDMLEVKLRNTRDYADTMIRYFRFSGLFKTQSRVRRLVIPEWVRWKAEQLVEEERLWRINKEINDKKAYYSWFGNPSIPRFPWESKEGYLREILANLERANGILDAIVES